MICSAELSVSLEGKTLLGAQPGGAEQPLGSPSRLQLGPHEISGLCSLWSLRLVSGRLWFSLLIIILSNVAFCSPLGEAWRWTF